MILQTPFQPTSTAPMPGTTQAGSWEDFLNTAVRGVNSIITNVQTGRAPAQTGYGWGGTTYPMVDAGTGARGDSGALVLILALVVIWVVAD